MDPLRQNILEAVECLRQRKCRPDRESICNYVLRKFGSSMNEIFAEVETIVDEGGLIKVEYKGTTSYRNPLSFDTKNSPLLTKHSKILNSSKTTNKIISGINELLTKDPNYSQVGVPLSELKKLLVEFDALRFNEENMITVLEREMNCGGIQVATSNKLLESVRVFPKDIPVPQDFQTVLSLTGNDEDEIEIDKKIKKARKGATDTALDVTTDDQKGRKQKINVIKKEGAKGDSGDEVDNEEAESDERMKPPKKTGKSSNIGKKIVAEKVAEAVRKSYESTAEFEMTSAQMVKLAEAVVSKQTDSIMPPLQPLVNEVHSQGPSLVLAGSIANEPPKTVNFEASVDVDDTNGAVPLDDGSVKEHVTTAPNSRQRRRKGAVIIPLSASTDLDEKESISPTETDQGSIRSKRDKRKKLVFDPSDLPNMYSRNKKQRLSDQVTQKSLPTPVMRRTRNSASGSSDKSCTNARDQTELNKIKDCSSLKQELTEEIPEPSACELLDLERIKQETTKTNKFCLMHNLLECSSCKNCDLCNEELTQSDGCTVSPSKADVGGNVFCKQCGSGFHISCVGEIQSPTRLSWICKICHESKKASPVAKKGKSKSNNNSNNSITEVKKSKAEQLKTTIDNRGHPVDLQLWSEEDVENYFVTKGLSEEAANLRRQGVDGFALLLLQREDVVNNMGFRLGPALKVYRLISELQSKAPVKPHSTWQEQTDIEKTS